MFVVIVIMEVMIPDLKVEKIMLVRRMIRTCYRLTIQTLIDNDDD